MNIPECGSYDPNKSLEDLEGCCLRTCLVSHHVIHVYIDEHYNTPSSLFLSSPQLVRRLSVLLQTVFNNLCLFHALNMFRNKDINPCRAMGAGVTLNTKGGYSSPTSKSHICDYFEAMFDFFYFLNYKILKMLKKLGVYIKYFLRNVF